MPAQKLDEAKMKEDLRRDRLHGGVETSQSAYNPQ